MEYSEELGIKIYSEQELSYMISGMEDCANEIHKEILNENSAMALDSIKRHYGHITAMMTISQLAEVDYDFTNIQSAIEEAEVYADGDLTLP